MPDLGKIGATLRFAVPPLEGDNRAFASHSLCPNPTCRQMCSEKLLPPMALRSLPTAQSASENGCSGVRPLARRALPIDTEALARYLVGKTLVHETPEGPIGGRIVETEAYVVGDAACHAFRGQTPRNRSLFLERGHAYVYFIYGCWFALNVAGGKAGIGTG